jgi:hypothetical protein
MPAVQREELSRITEGGWSAADPKLAYPMGDVA